MNWSQYLALRGIAGFISSFDINANLFTAETIGTLFYKLHRGRRERAERNIALSFPDWSREKIQSVAERSMQHMFKLFMVEAIMAPRLVSPSTWTRYIHLGSVQQVMGELVRGKPAVFITGHCGNWEMLGCAMASIGYPLVALARPLDNPLINRWLLEVRESRGMKIITKWGATPILQDTLRDGGRVAFIADQNAGDQGLFVPFFGRLASSYKSIGLLAMRYKVPVIAGFAQRINDCFEYEMSCIDLIRPDEWESQPDPLFYITARYNRAMEQMVRMAPDQYLWLHRRWKSRPKHEREGEPMPKRLIEKLEQLPWMTQEDLEQLKRGENQI